MATSLNATLDAWVDQDGPTQNHGQAAYLWLNGDGSHTKKAYIFFGKPFPPLAYISSATLTLYVGPGGWSGSKTITIKRVTTIWTENGITYNTIPTVDATHSASTAVTSPVAGQAITFDLTTMLTDVSGGGAWFGVEVTISGTTTVKLYASENPDQTKRASLDVDWSKIPEDPVSVVPANSQAVSLPMPTIAWQFDTKDHSATRRQASSQVQIDSASTAFASIEYDSGQESNTINNWDLSLASTPNYNISMGTFTVTIASPAVFTFTSHGLVVGDPVHFTTTGALPTGLSVGPTYYVSAVPGANTFRVSATLGGADVNTSGTQSGTHTLSRFGIQDGATRYARVRVWDDKGQVSAYSDAVTFTRSVKGTLTMSLPGAGGTVTETTPPITWSLSGRTQEAFELRLYRYDGTTKTRIWRLPKTTSTSLSYNLPNGLLHETDTYNIELFVWDTIDRAVTPGDPDYVTVNHDFTYVRAGVGAAVTGLTPTAVDGGVQLDFARASTPDYFAVKEDGKLVPGLDRLDPTVLSTGGTNYRFTYWKSKPNTAHTLEVEAVALSAGILKHSSGNSTANHTPTPIGIILSDPDDNTRIRVTGPESLTPDLAIGEEGTTYAPIGSRHKVRIVDSVGGYEGSISGQVQGAQERDDFLTLKGRSPKPLRLIMGDVNIEVILEEVSGPSPRGDIPAAGGRYYDVGFSFFQSNAEDTFGVLGF